MQHTYRAGGKTNMEVDHFNPNKKADLIQYYNNLFLASSHCNRAKRDRWPTNKDRKLGIRFLNCCKEADYGTHIFEDPDTHEVVGVTSEGKYHVRNCDLNAPHLVQERAERADLWRVLNAQPMRLKQGWALPEETKLLRGAVERMIPRIPSLSGKHLAKQRAIKKALAETKHKPTSKS
jgi:hypothetical protein